MAEPTVADLAERYLRMHVAVQCKASSMKVYEQLLRNQILPALGEMPVGAAVLEDDGLSLEEVAARRT